MKVSYRCMPDMGQAINKRNKKVLTLSYIVVLEDLSLLKIQQHPAKNFLVHVPNFSKQSLCVKTLFLVHYQISKLL